MNRGQRWPAAVITIETEEEIMRIIALFVVLLGLLLALRCCGVYWTIRGVIENEIPAGEENIVILVLEELLKAKGKPGYR